MNGKDRYVGKHVERRAKGLKILASLRPTYISSGKGRGAASNARTFKRWKYLLGLNDGGYDTDYTYFVDNVEARAMQVPALIREYLKFGHITFTEVVARFPDEVTRSVDPISERLAKVGAYGYFGMHKKHVVEKPIGRKVEHASIWEPIEKFDIYDPKKVNKWFTERHLIETMIFPLRQGSVYIGSIDKNRIHARYITDYNEIVEVASKDGKETYTIYLPSRELSKLKKKDQNIFFSKYIDRYRDIFGKRTDEIVQDGSKKFIEDSIIVSCEDALTFLAKSGLKYPEPYFASYGLSFTPAGIYKINGALDKNNIKIIYREPRDNEEVGLTLNKKTLDLQFRLGSDEMSSEQLSLHLKNNFFHEVTEKSRLFKTSPKEFQQVVREDCSLEHTLKA